MKDELNGVKIVEFIGVKSKIGTCEINKISLVCLDDKRYVLDNGINTLAYFNKEIKTRQGIRALIKNIDII